MDKSGYPDNGYPDLQTLVAPLSWEVQKAICQQYSTAL